MSLSIPFAFVCLLVALAAGVAYWRDRAIQRRMNELRVDELLGEWAAIKRRQRDCYGRFTVKATWYK